MMKIFSGLMPFFLLSALAGIQVGCLKTRENVEQRQVMQQQTTNLQRTTADTGSRLTDIEEQIRFLNGRVEVVENKQNTGTSSTESVLKSSQQQQQESNLKMSLMQEALTKMEGQIFQMTAEIQTLKIEKAAVTATQTAKQVQKDVYEAGQDFFTQKDWKKAILNYQKYRDENPKGKHYAEATYKIGVSFQELGMKDEAKTFYDEVASKFPQSDQARKAKTRLKVVKK